MKKIASVLIVLAAIAAVSCGSSPSATGPSQVRQEDVPSFVLNPPNAEDAIFGVGAAKMATLDASMRFAESRARVSIAQAINTRVQNMITDYISGSEGSAREMSNFQESVSRSLTDATLSGAIVAQRGRSADGTCYALVSIPKDVARQAAIARLGENPNRALAQRALQNMDQAFNNANYNVAPTPVTN